MTEVQEAHFQSTLQGVSLEEGAALQAAVIHGVSVKPEADLVVAAWRSGQPGPGPS